MLIFGTGEKKLSTANQEKCKCPSCKKYNLEFYFFRSYGHLFWIPTIPTTLRTVAYCDACGATWENQNIPDTLEYKKEEARKGVKFTPIPFIGAIVFPVLLVVIGMNLNQSDSYVEPYESSEDDFIETVEESEESGDGAQPWPTRI